MASRAVKEESIRSEKPYGEFTDLSVIAEVDSASLIRFIILSGCGLEGACSDRTEVGKKSYLCESGCVSVHFAQIKTKSLIS